MFYRRAQGYWMVSKVRIKKANQSGVVWVVKGRAKDMRVIAVYADVMWRRATEAERWEDHPFAHQLRKPINQYWIFDGQLRDDSPVIGRLWSDLTDRVIAGAGRICLIENAPIPALPLTTASAP
jgi:hypothetical protein